MKKLRIALIGCGRISACYANAFPKLSDIAEFVCAIDTDIEKARAFAAPFGAAYGTGFEDLQEKHEFEGYIRPLKQSAACFNAA